MGSKEENRNYFYLGPVIWMACLAPRANCWDGPHLNPSCLNSSGVAKRKADQCVMQWVAKVSSTSSKEMWHNFRKLSMVKSCLVHINLGSSCAMISSAMAIRRHTGSTSSNGCCLIAGCHGLSRSAELERPRFQSRKGDWPHKCHLAFAYQDVPIQWHMERRWPPLIWTSQRGLEMGSWSCRWHHIFLANLVQQQHNSNWVNLQHLPVEQVGQWDNPCSYESWNLCVGKLMSSIQELWWWGNATSLVGWLLLGGWFDIDFCLDYWYNGVHRGGSQ